MFQLAANYLDVKDKIMGLRWYKQELQDRLEREGGEEEEGEQERIKGYLRLQQEKVMWSTKYWMSYLISYGKWNVAKVRNIMHAAHLHTYIL